MQAIKGYINKRTGYELNNSTKYKALEYKVRGSVLHYHFVLLSKNANRIIVK